MDPDLLIELAGIVGVATLVVLAFAGWSLVGYWRDRSLTAEADLDALNRLFRI